MKEIVFFAVISPEPIPGIKERITMQVRTTEQPWMGSLEMDATWYPDAVVERILLLDDRTGQSFCLVVSDQQWHEVETFFNQGQTRVSVKGNRIGSSLIEVSSIEVVPNLSAHTFECSLTFDSCFSDNQNHVSTETKLFVVKAKTVEQAVTLALEECKRTHFQRSDVPLCSPL